LLLQFKQKRRFITAFKTIPVSCTALHERSANKASNTYTKTYPSL